MSLPIPNPKIKIPVPTAKEFWDTSADTPEDEALLATGAFDDEHDESGDAGSQAKPQGKIIHIHYHEE